MLFQSLTSDIAASAPFGINRFHTRYKVEDVILNFIVQIMHLGASYHPNGEMK